MKVLILLLQLSATGNDAYWTDRNLQQCSHCEYDPIARPFVKNRAGLVAYFSASAAVKIAVPYELRKHHHGKIARVLEVYGIGDSVYGGTISAVRSN